ncbi:hypothetical protein BpHYR1_026437 [Brachionus plicatilis]|uniref:Uncharacterized protein n=1 Tax=Brachionus plicatilis TaxID=10195 RepID=A0A3M7S8B2_BRAPC|nr:hypothetical protein BpHYR1_026437 [Brachionus plicatilis]
MYLINPSSQNLPDHFGLKPIFKSLTCFPHLWSTVKFLWFILKSIDDICCCNNSHFNSGIYFSRANVRSNETII